MTTLIFDSGMGIVGIFSVEEEKYIAYCGDAIPSAIQRIEAADEVVTYNGSVQDGWSDLAKLAEFAGKDRLALKGVHTDMRIICWSERIWGMNLRDTYAKHFGNPPVFPDTHEGSNESDVYMTYKLWQLWKQGKLKIIDGHQCSD